jgi:hypothetical protein
MPFGLWPVNDGPEPSLIGLNDGGWMPPLRFHPSNLEPKDDLGIWPECGAPGIKTLFADGPKMHLLQGYFDDAGLQKAFDLRLTRREAEAYIPAIGAPSAYGAIARL